MFMTCISLPDGELHEGEDSTCFSFLYHIAQNSAGQVELELVQPIYLYC
jgi:hypothetical protein